MQNTTGGELEDELLLEAEERARAVLRETGFEQFIDGLDSDEVWNAFQAAARHDGTFALSPTARAYRARLCLLVVEHIRAAIEDQDASAAFRHGVALGTLDRDLLGHAERDAVVHRNRMAALEKATLERLVRSKTRRTAWKAKAYGFKAKNPGASAREIAKHVAGSTGANSETVRKALRTRTAKRTKAKP